MKQVVIDPVPVRVDRPNLDGGFYERAEVEELGRQWMRNGAHTR